MKRLLKIFIAILFLIPIISLGLIINGTNAPRSIRGVTYTDFDFSLSSSTRQDTITGTVTGTTSQKDIILNSVTSGVVDTASNLLSTPITQGFLSVNYSSLDPSIATVNSSGRVTRVSNGTARINAAVQVSGNNGSYTKLTKQTPVSVSRSGGQNTMTFNSYAPGSLAKNASDQIDSRINGKTSSAGNTEIFSTQDHTNAIYVWNTSNWLYGVDMTMISPWNSARITQGSGTLISPRSIIVANHFNTPPGNTIRFIKQDGTVVTERIAASTNITGSDIMIETLDSDVPAGIGFAKVLPANYATYLPSITSTTTIPAIGFLGGGNVGAVNHPNKTATVRELESLNSVVGNIGTVALYFQTASTTRSNFYVADVVGGDSGNPFFLLVNGQLVLLDADYAGGAGYGPFVSNYITQINAAMTAMGDPYSLTTIDLSSFNTY